MGDYPPIKNGTRVRATVRRSGKNDYLASAIVARALHSGEIGVVCEYHDSHGLCYGVKFEDDAVAYFDPEELETVTITIRVHRVRVLDDNGRDKGPHCHAVGYMSSGQVLIEGRIFAGHSPSVQDMAVKEVVDWLTVHRAGFTVEVLSGIVPVGAFDPHPDA